jgi:hypothetical protein
MKSRRLAAIAVSNYGLTRNTRQTGATSSGVYIQTAASGTDNFYQNHSDHKVLTSQTLVAKAVSSMIQSTENKDRKYGRFRKVHRRYVHVENRKSGNPRGS